MIRDANVLLDECRRPRLRVRALIELRPVFLQFRNRLVGGLAHCLRRIILAEPVQEQAQRLDDGFFGMVVHILR